MSLFNGAPATPGGATKRGSLENPPCLVQRRRPDTPGEADEKLVSLDLSGTPEERPPQPANYRWTTLGRLLGRSGNGLYPGVRTSHVHCCLSGFCCCWHDRWLRCYGYPFRSLGESHWNIPPQLSHLYCYSLCLFTARVTTHTARAWIRRIMNSSATPV